MPEVKCGFDNPHLLVHHGPVVRIHIEFNPKFDLRNPTPPNQSKAGYIGLIDTGCTYSCIDSSLADSLQFPIVNRQTVSGVAGRFETNEYLAQVYVSGLNHYLYGKFSGAHLKSGGLPYDALLGRDFLLDMNMVYDGGSGEVVLSKIQR